MMAGAHGETRTLKDITPTASETATFTNFATWANHIHDLVFEIYDLRNRSHTMIA